MNNKSTEKIKKNQNDSWYFFANTYTTYESSVSLMRIRGSQAVENSTDRVKLNEKVFGSSRNSKTEAILWSVEKKKLKLRDS